MKNSEKLVWKLIDREITDEEFKELQNELSADSDLRTYYQNALETDSTLSNRHHTPFLNFNEGENKKSAKVVSFFSLTGWIAAAVVICFALLPKSSSDVKLSCCIEPRLEGTFG